MGTISSEEINYLVYRYLQESGFTHSAFTFAYESVISKSMISQQGAKVPPGTLIAFLQKGLQMVAMEHHINDDGSERPYDEGFSLLTPHICQSAGQKGMVRKADVAGLGRTSSRAEDEERATSPQPEKKARSHQSKLPPECEVEKADVATLRSHTSEVFCCSWNPKFDLLATGSGDATARIWSMPGASSSSGSSSPVLSPSPSSLCLVHDNPAKQAAAIASEAAGASTSDAQGGGDEAASGNGGDGEPNPDVNGDRETKPAAAAAAEEDKAERDVTTLEWSPDGQLLATGGMDGMARIWGKDGQLHHTLSGHCEAIFSMRFNQAGSLLLTGSYDFSTVVWDVKTGQPRQRYQVHSRQVLDVDWKDDETFASCSSDKTIHVAKLGEEKPICMFQGHKDEVNAVKWDPSGQILASCSDDHTAKIWVMGQTKYVHDLREHSKEIYTIRWSPTGPGSDHPNKKLMLASASFDSMVKLWDVETGTRLHNLNRHVKKVYTVAFSPDGEYLASGSLGGQLYIWSVKDGSIVKSFRGDADIYDVAWNSSGNKIACCGATESNAVTIIDFRM